MASAVIHLCVAKNINKIINKDTPLFYLGNISPDISKQIGETKKLTHFLKDDISNIPNYEIFISKYKEKLNNPFVLGYLTHLLVDYYWFKEYIDEYIRINGELIKDYIYDDYNALNCFLINYYELDLKLFYNNINLNFDIIEELEENKLQILIDKMGEIIMNAKSCRLTLFSEIEIIDFIESVTDKILNLYRELKLI